MNQKIIIESPCDANWNKMPKNNTGRHCATCQTTVVDFSKMALEDIHLYFKNNSHQKICGKYHKRHTPVSNKWFHLLNKIEIKFAATKFKKLALALIYILLFFTGCKTKHNQTVGTRRFVLNKDSKSVEMTSLAKK